MATTVDICNLALSNIGQKATINSIAPPDASIEAQDCARFYPMALKQALAEHAWGFAVTRQALGEVADAAPASWTYAYQYPNLCLRVLSVLNEDTTDDQDTQKFIREGDLIYTNVPDATVRYIRYITDTNKYSPEFVNALSHFLSAMLAGKLIKGEAGTNVAKAELKAARSYFGIAAADDANSERAAVYQEYVPSSVRARE